MLQCGFGDRHIQRLIGVNSRVRCGTAQWARLAGLQGFAVLVQALDTAFLYQQLLLVGHLFLERCVLCMQHQALGLVRLGGGLALLNV